MRVYKFGLLGPIEGAETVREQLRLAHRYRNQRIEIERGRRAALRLAMADSTALVQRRGAEEATALQSLEAALADLRASKSTTRGPGDASAREAVKLARVAHRAAVADLRLARTEARSSPALVLESDRINELAHQLHLNARHHSGLCHGTYQLVDAAMEAAAKAPLYDGAEPNDPRYERWAGEGSVSVQVQGGMSVEEVMGDRDTFVRIAPVDGRAWLSPVRGARRRLSRTIFSLRVGSRDERPTGHHAAPVWARWPMIMHRALPERSRVKVATVTLRRVGRIEQWAVCLTVDDAATPRAQGPEVSLVTAIDIGWRVIDDEIRVCRWADSSGASGELRLDRATLASLRKPSELRSIRDRNFNAAREALHAWLATATVPEWMGHQSARLSQWRSSGRLANLAQWWAAHRFEGDGPTFAALESWRYHDDHLWQWECDQRQQALGRRRELFRRFAADMARRSAEVVLEIFDLRAFAVLPYAEDDESEQAAFARANRHLVATSELRLAVRNACSSRSRTVSEVPAERSTITCHVCGLVEAFDAAAELRHACGGCGEEWDQDHNASAVILSRRERLRAIETAGVAREGSNAAEVPAKKETRRERIARLMTAKALRKEAARDVLANGAE